jgi:hypothetical protein
MMISRFLIPALLLTEVTSTILSDSGCDCALLQSTLTTPYDNGSFAVGCAVKPSWTGLPSKWCFTDQTTSVCGTNQTGFGVVDTCASAGFPTVSLSNQTLYTNQNLTVSWTNHNILPDELIKISVGRFILTSGQGVNSSVGSWTGKISSSVTSTNTSVVLSTVSSPAVLVNSTQFLTVLPSSLLTPTVYNNQTLAGTGGSGVAIVGQNLTIKWLGVGDAASGIASVTIASNGGGGGGGGSTVGTPLTGVPVVPGNMSVGYILPRTFVPNGFSTYSARITVVGISGSTYTLTSSSFSLTAGPSVTPASSATPTTTPTPTPSLSTGSTPSNTPTSSATSSQTPTSSSTPSTTPTPSLTIGYTQSVTPTQTPTLSDTASNTPTLSITSSITPSPSPPINLAAIQAAATAASNVQTQLLVGGILGGLVGIVLIGFGIHKINQRYQSRLRRLRGNRAASRKNIDEELRSVYGVQPTVSIVYQQDIYRSPQPAQVGRGSNRSLTYQQQRQQRLAHQRQQQTSSV